MQRTVWRTRRISEFHARTLPTPTDTFRSAKSALHLARSELHY
jgi:hypothetical protein